MLSPLLRITSFGFKYDEANDFDLIVDCRDLPNPYWVEELRGYNGKDACIVSWLEKHPEIKEAFQKMARQIEEALQGKETLSVGVGCTGGQHRSVYFAERLAQYFSSKCKVELTHRELWRFTKR